jgi:ferrous iron transport protein B
LNIAVPLVHNPVEQPALAPPQFSPRLARFTVALLGNPNTGKTTLFNALTNLQQRVGNYPGVTVETKKGRFLCEGHTVDVIDLPGTYSLAPRSPDEMLVVDLVLGQTAGQRRPDVLLCIVDASNLERNLYLTTQAMELGLPVVVALNMVDIATGQGIHVDSEKLSQKLGLPVWPIQANKGKGLENLKHALCRTAESGAIPSGPAFPHSVLAEEASLDRALGGAVSPFLLRRLLLDVGGFTEKRVSTEANGRLPALLDSARRRLEALGCKMPETEARTRYAWIRDALRGCVQRPVSRPVAWTDRIDRILTHRIAGTVVFLAVMFIVFQSIFTWARPAMDAIDWGREQLSTLVEAVLGPGPLRSLIVDGCLKGVGSVLVFLPQILILFGFIAILEDCGYMARAAFLMDKLMARCGLSGKSFIPLLSSVACAVPGIMATRVIENRRDRLATILVAPLMSCSARLPVYTLLIGAFLTEGFAWWLPGLVMFSMYAIGLVLSPLVALCLKRTLLRGETPVFVMEMPLYKWPSWRTVLRRMVDSGRAFIRRAGTLILASMILVWALLYFPATNDRGESYEARIAQQQQLISEHPNQGGGAQASAFDVSTPEQELHRLLGEWRRQSWLGRCGRLIEPAVRPLGWDWRIGMAALASFPAREVVVGTLGMIYNTGRIDPDQVRSSHDPEAAARTRQLQNALRQASWQDAPDRKVFSVPVALSLMVFFALCCQCASTLAVIRRETNSWRWPLFTFTYMTALAYVAALLVYQVGSRLPI